MQLNVSYDSTTSATAPTAFFDAVSYVVNLFDRIFTNNSTVNIEVGYGTFPEDGSPVTSLGVSDQNNVVFGNYSSIRQTLIGEGAPGANTLPSVSPFTGNITLGSAEQKALGLVGADSSLDGWVGIASDDELTQMTGGSWSFDPTATPGPNQFYIVGVLEHEFTEVMGRTSYLSIAGEYGVMDLYRWRQNGSRQTGTGDPAYFSIDGGNTNLDSWNDASISGGDLGDWAPDVGPRLNFKYAGADAFLSESPPGQINGLSSTDLTLMAALGWSKTPARPGDQYVFSAPGETVNLVRTNDGNNLPPAIAGEFNIELVTQPVGTSYPLPSGYQAVALLPGGTGLALQVLTGDLAVNDTGSGDAITLGSGAQTVIGATGDTIVGGSGALSVDGSRGGQRINAGSSGSAIVSGAGDTIFGSTGSGSALITGAAGDTIVAGSGADFIEGTAGSESIGGGSGVATVVGGLGDTIVGGAGPLTVVGGAAGGMAIDGGDGGLTAYDLGTQSLATGGGGTVFIDDSYPGGGNSTLVGGSGAVTFLKGGVGDSIVGGTGTSTVIDAHLGAQTVTGGPGQVTFIAAANGDELFAGDAVSVFIASGGSDTIVGGTSRAPASASATDVYLAGANDSIIGQSGNLTVAGSAAPNLTVVGGVGDLEVFNLGSGSSVVGASSGTTVINDAYGGGGNATLVGGAAATTIVAGANDSIVGGPGSMEVRVRSDVSGVETINLSAAASGVRDVNVGGAGANATITGFDTGSDRIESSTDNGAYLVAHATTDAGGNVVLHFSDHSIMMLANVTDASTITFTA